MKLSKLEHYKSVVGTRRRRIGAVGASALVAVLSLGFAVTAQAAAVAVPLGTTTSFAILAGSGITNTGVTTVNGDIGSYPTASETGTTACPGSNCFALTGANDAGNGATQTAKTDLTAAYNYAAGEGPINSISTIGAGETLTAGVYNSASAIQLNGSLTLNGGPGAVFVFQAGSTLTSATGSTVLLTGGAQACNVFWQVGSSTTLNTGSTFQGTILNYDDISLGDSVTVQGRLLAGEQASGAGAVTLIHDTITTPACSTGGTTTTSTASSTTSTTKAPVHHSGGGGSHKKGGGSSGGSSTGTTSAAHTTAAVTVSKTPKGGVQTGGGSTAGVQHMILFALGSVLILGGAGAMAYRRRPIR